MTEGPPRRRLAAIVGGLIVLAVAGGVLGSNLPAATARSDRAEALLELERQAAALAQEIEGVSADASAVRSAIQEQTAAAGAIQAKVDGQLRRISKLTGRSKNIRAEIKDLEKELADLQGS